MEMSKRQGKLVVVSGPSGVGKSTIVRQAVQRLGLHLSVSATTRPRGAGETDGKDYSFLSKDEFQRRLADGAFLEHAEVFGNHYGTPRDPVERAMADGQTVILEIDVQGGVQVKAAMPEAVMIFILPPRIDELLRRIEARNRGEDEQARQRRLAKAETEIAAGKLHYEFFVVNDVLDKAVRDVVNIIQEHQNQ
ncbi:MAG: guanylate kinase [Phycisphaerae bacterium]|jgi:guanylate kinase|nr:guanylate kinase [Phycisphaerae bacterium]